MKNMTKYRTWLLNILFTTQTAMHTRTRTWHKQIQSTWQHQWQTKIHVTTSWQVTSKCIEWHDSHWYTDWWTEGRVDSTKSISFIGGWGWGGGGVAHNEITCQNYNHLLSDINCMIPCNLIDLRQELWAYLYNWEFFCQLVTFKITSHVHRYARDLWGVWLLTPDGKEDGRGGKGRKIQDSRVLDSVIVSYSSLVIN